jgi:hypothetical protein
VTLADFAYPVYALGFIVPKTLYYLAFQSSVGIKCDINVFRKVYLYSILNFTVVIHWSDAININFQRRYNMNVTMTVDYCLDDDAT